MIARRWGVSEKRVAKEDDSLYKLAKTAGIVDGKTPNRAMMQNLNTAKRQKLDEASKFRTIINEVSSGSNVEENERQIN